MADSKLKIGLLVDTTLDTTDGVPQYVLRLGSWLTSHGQEVHYLSGHSKRRDLKNLHTLARNINVKFNGNKISLPIAADNKKIKTLIKNEQFDILHVQTPHHPLLAQKVIMQASSQTAVIGTFHILPYGRLAKIGNKLLGIALRPSLKRIDKMLAVSQAAAEFCKTSFKVNAQVVPNMVDYKLFKNAMPLPQYQDDKINILFLGRLVERKGCLTLLKAINSLKKDSLPALRVIICGRGALESTLKQYVADNGLSDEVEFTGFVSEDDKPRYYASADIAIFPSSGGESFGIVLLEAMASGKAVVLAGDNPGYASVMTPQPSLLFDPKDIAELSSKIKNLIEDSKQRQGYAEWGTNYAASFDINIVGQKILDIYNQMLQKRRKQ